MKVFDRGDPRGFSPGETPGEIVFLIPPFPGENFPIPRGKLNKKLPKKVIFFYVISLFFTFCYIFGHLWFQICIIATLYLNSGEYFHTLKVFADNKKFDQISDGEKWNWKFWGKSSCSMEILMFGVKISVVETKFRTNYFIFLSW